MSEPSDFDSIVSDGVMSPCSSLEDVIAIASNSTNVHKENVRISVYDTSSYDTPQQDVSLTDSDQSLLEAPKLMTASSPSSICSMRPLEWDSGADVGYDITAKQQSQVMSTIERIAVSNLVNNANSTPIGCEKRVSLKTKSNSLINLNGIEIAKENKSASFEALKVTPTKSDTLPKCRSPMASSLSVSTVVNKIEFLNNERLKQINDKHINLVFELQEKKFEKLNINSNNEQKSSESSKESNSTLGSADTAGSWVAKEFRDSTNTTTDRVNSFEYLPGNEYYNSRNDELEDCSDKEIKQNTKMLVEAMKQNGLTNELHRKEIFKEIIESFLKNYVHKDNNSSIKSASDTDQTPIRQDFTSQTSNTGNTVVNNQTNNHSSTITFTSPVTSSRYGDDVDSKYDESSMDSGRHIDLQKCKSKKLCTPTNKCKNQGVQCTIYNNVNTSGKSKQSTSTKSDTSKKTKEYPSMSCPKNNVPNKLDYSDIHKEFKKQMICFHMNYMKAEKENQMLWINSQISHLNNLKRLFNTHEELKKNWNSYKQEPLANNKLKFSRRLLPESSSDCISTTKTDSTNSSKQFSCNSSKTVTSRCDTDADSSATVCDHVHYKKGIPVHEPKSMITCCQKTIHVIAENQKRSTNKFKTTCSQTDKLVDQDRTKSNIKCSSQNSAIYTVDQKLKPMTCSSSLTYDIIFKPTPKVKKNDSICHNSKPKKNSISVACQTNDVPFKLKSSLQEYLMTNRPDYVCRAEERRHILNDMACLRDERKQLKRNLLITNSHENNIPPNPLAIKRVMSQKEMRKQTERKYRKCLEVKNKKKEIKRKEEYKINKIMANVFNKRLQKKTLKGNVDLSNSVSVCSL